MLAHETKSIQLPVGHNPRIMREATLGHLVVRDDATITPEERAAQPRARRLKVGDLVVYRPSDETPVKALVEEIHDEAREVVVQDATRRLTRHPWSSIIPLTESTNPVIVNVVSVGYHTDDESGSPSITTIACTSIEAAHRRIELLDELNTRHGIVATHELQFSVLYGAGINLR